MIRNALLIALGVVCFAGCTMVPHYTRPAPPVPGEWPTGPAYEGVAGDLTGPSAADIGWREFYPDDRLQKIIELALVNNRDLRVAALNIERARGFYRIQRAALFPEVDASGDTIQEKVPAFLSPTGKG